MMIENEILKQSQGKATSPNRYMSICPWKTSIGILRDMLALEILKESFTAEEWVKTFINNLQDVKV